MPQKFKIAFPAHGTVHFPEQAWIHLISWKRLHTRRMNIPHYRAIHFRVVTRHRAAMMWKSAGRGVETGAGVTSICSIQHLYKVCYSDQLFSHCAFRPPSPLPNLNSPSEICHPFNFYFPIAKCKITQTLLRWTVFLDCLNEAADDVQARMIDAPIGCGMMHRCKNKRLIPDDITSGRTRAKPVTCGWCFRLSREKSWMETRN